MAVNPFLLLKAKERLAIFQKDHPKVMPFFSMIKDRTLEEGTVYELKATTPDGHSYVTNIRLTQNDLDTIQMLMKESKDAEP